VAYAVITERMTDEERVIRFEEEIGMRTNPEEAAKAALRAWQEAQGITFDDPDAPVPAPLGSRDEEVPGTWMGR
jgi:hypothetical protein